MKLHQNGKVKYRLLLRLCIKSLHLWAVSRKKFHWTTCQFNLDLQRHFRRELHLWQISKCDLQVILNLSRKMKLFRRVVSWCKVESIWMQTQVLSCLRLINTEIKNKRRCINFLMSVPRTLGIFKIQHRRQLVGKITNTLQISSDKKIGKRCWKNSIRQ